MYRMLALSDLQDRQYSLAVFDADAASRAVPLWPRLALG